MRFRDDAQPEVSLVIPTLQEEASIGECIDSLLGQTYPRIKEILVLDGGSADRTREIVQAYGPPVRLVENPGVTAASAMNIGLSASTSPVVVRIDAHTRYSEDYVELSVQTLMRSGAAMVGGPMRPRGTTRFGQAVALVTSSPLAVGPGKFHYAEQAGPVDTVYLGTFFVVDVQAVGGYDATNLQWAAEDQELNYRIRKNGWTVYLDPAIRSWYEPRSTPRALAKQYRNYGLAKASTLKKHGRLPSWRPLAPAALLMTSLTGLIGGVVTRSLALALFIPTAHLAVVSIGAVSLTWRQKSLLVRSIAAVLICHWSYAIGFMQGIGRLLTGRGFDSRPRGGRRV